MNKSIKINNTNKNIKETILKFASEVRNKERTEITLNLKIYIPTPIFDVDFRNNLIKHIRASYESRAYYIFYISKIDYNPIVENELPLVKLEGEQYVINLPLDMNIIYFEKDDTVSLKLILDNNVMENKINVFGENTYIYCKINLTNNQIIEAGHQRAEAIKDNIYNKIYKKGDIINVKITSFFNNQLHNGFSSKINCEGILI